MYTKKELLTIFNLSDLALIKTQRRYHLARRERVKNKINTLEILDLKLITEVMQIIVSKQIAHGYKVLDKISTTLNYLNKQAKYYKEVEIAKKNNTTPPTPVYTEYDKDYIKANTPIELLLGTPKKIMHGGNKFYCCPFHNEKTPSFVWNENKKLFNCFGCGKGGDIITLYQHINGTTFQETLKLLS